MAPSVVIGLEDLRRQARAGSPSIARQVAPTRGRRTPVVRVVLLGSIALLVLSAAWPGSGGFGVGPAEAAQGGSGSGTVAVQPGVPAPGLPATGSTTTSSPGRASTRPAGPAVVESRRSSCSAPCSTSQVISVTIRPGPFEVTAARTSVAVATGSDGVGRARLTGVRVTDLRGASQGWTLSTRVVSVVDTRTGAAVPGATVELAPACVRTAGPLTLENADPSVVPVGGTASLCVVPIASQGSLAGGLVSAEADLVVRGAPSDTELRVVLDTALA